MLVCRICLQPGEPRTVDLDATLEAFYDELMYYDVIQHQALTICTYCEYLLRKAYNFRQRCRRAHILLKLRTKDDEKKNPINVLWMLLPKSSVSIVSNNAVQKVYAYIDNRYESDCGTTIDNHALESLVPVDNNHVLKIDIGVEEDITKVDINTNDLDNTANDFENTDPNRTDVESDDYLNDNFDDFFKTDIQVNKETDEKMVIRKEKRKKLLAKKRAKIRDMLKEYFKEGKFEDLDMDEDMMLKLFDRISTTTLKQKGILNTGRNYNLDRRRREFLHYLMRVYDPKYETVYDIEVLESRDQKVAEFVSRQQSEQFIKAQYKCFICFMILPRSGLHDYHNELLHDESLPFKCDICLCGFLNLKKLKKHMYKNHTIVYRCKKCCFITWNRVNMKTHYDKHANNGIFCNICGKQFITGKTMSQHLLRHNRGTCCPFCAGFFVNMGLATHIRCKHKHDPLYNATPALKCTECDAGFHNQDALNIHLQRDHIEYRCSCGEVFPDEMSLATHTKEKKHPRPKIKTRTDVVVTYIRCDACGMNVPKTSKYALRIHYRSAHPTQPYVRRNTRLPTVLCEHCGLACEVGPDYEDHLNTHLEEKPYECNECGARFAVRAVAERHSKIHTKKKEKIVKNAVVVYECDVCSKKFSHKYFLIKHIKNHEDFNREVVTSRVVLPVFNGPKKLNSDTKIINSITKNDNKSLENNEGSIKNTQSLQDEENFINNTEQHVASGM